MTSKETEIKEEIYKDFEEDLEMVSNSQVNGLILTWPLLIRLRLTWPLLIQS